MTRESCGVCKKKISSQENALLCSMCDKVYHANCEAVKLANLQVIREEDMLWFCKTCKPKVKSCLDKVVELEEKMEGLVTENIVMKNQVSECCERLAKLEQKEQLIHEVKKQVMEDLREDSEREKRKNNIMIYNFPEPSKDTYQENYEEDLQTIKQIIKDEIKVNVDSEIEEIVRLGTWRRNPTTGVTIPRPMIVKLKRENMKWAVLKSCKNLKYTTNAIAKSLSVSKDMTRQEREQHKMLMVELREKVNKGETGWYIKNNCLVKEIRSAQMGPAAHMGTPAI